MAMPRKPGDFAPPILRPVIQTSSNEAHNRWMVDAMPNTCGVDLAVDIQMSYVNASNIRAGMADATEHDFQHHIILLVLCALCCVPCVTCLTANKMSDSWRLHDPLM